MKVIQNTIPIKKSMFTIVFKIESPSYFFKKNNIIDCRLGNKCSSC